LFLLVVTGMAQTVQNPKTDERAQRLQEMERRIRAIRAYSSPDCTGTPLVLMERPLLRFDDPARDFHDATLWAWGPAGRPVGLVAIERYSQSWSYEFVSLTPNHVSAVTEHGVRWTPRKPGVDWREVPNAPAPANSAVRRLSQMKMLVRRFEASESTPDGQEYHLRLLSRPIRLYSDPKAGLVDGALFVFAYGINPEMLAVLECREERPAKPKWLYSFAPLTTARVEVRLGDQIVWTKPIPPPLPDMTATYAAFRVPAGDGDR
jgi:hypothetical protein